MSRGRINKRSDKKVYLDNKTRIQPRQHYQVGFSPILGEGDALDVKYSGTLHNPRYIEMTIPEKKAPYTFVPVVENSDRSLLVKPVLHDRTKKTGEKDLHTGLIHCDLRTLTPMLVGHYAYEVKDARPDKVDTTGLDKDKTILEPLFLNNEPDSPVILPGTGIKGMVRHNIGAMFNAPMERVQEQFFSYRPNLAWIDKPDHYECREAVVEEFVRDADDKIISIQVQVLPKGRHAIYVTRNLFGMLNRQYGDTISGGEVNELSLGVGRGMKRFRLDERGDGLPSADQYRVCHYRPGIDGEGELNEVQDGSTKDDAAVLVSECSIEKQAIGSIDGKYVAQYQRTQLELADKKFGHRSRSDFKSRDGLWDRVGGSLRQIRKDQLIYVEVDKKVAQSDKDYIVSFGQHYRYRWAYADSIRTTDRKLGGDGKPVGIRRRQVHPNPRESVKGEDDDRLTVPRALFGCVAGDNPPPDDKGEDRENHEMPDDQEGANPGSRGVGKGVYARLAGRIAINHAVEVGHGDGLDKRFITNNKPQDNRKFDIRLRILGAPKASAVEHYLEHEKPKDEKKYNLKTYGDLPGTDHSGSGTPLAGRKFYRHQKDSDCVERDPKKKDPDFVEKDSEKSTGNQSTLARYISREDRTFRFTVRFKDLRDWELGALLLALNPDYARKLLAGDKQRLQVDSTPNEGGDGVYYANKLGHGRPLGLGSIHFGIQELSILNDNLDLQNRTGEAAEFVEKAAGKIDPQNTATWLKILNWRQRPAAVDYPNAEANIYTYHTNIRAHYSKQRRKSDSTMSEDFHKPVRP